MGTSRRTILSRLSGWRITMWALITAPVLLGVWFCVLPAINESLFGRIGDDLRPGRIESLAIVRFPTSMREYRSRAINFRSLIGDPVIYARFEVKASDLPAFVASTKCPTTLAPSSAPLVKLMDDLPPWWDAHTVGPLQGTRVDHGTAEPAQEIWVAPAADEGWVIVYLYVDYI